MVKPTFPFKTDIVMQIGYLYWSKNSNHSMCSCFSLIQDTCESKIDMSLFSSCQNDIESMDLLAAQASLLTYSEAADIFKVLALADHKTIHSVENAFAVSWKQSSTWVLSFRGTELNDWRDIIDDSDVRLGPLEWADSCKAHVGFSRHFGKLLESITAAIQELPLDELDIALFTGHSLGGAVSYLAAFYFEQILRNNGFKGQIQLYTFGAPKIGTSELLYWCAARDSLVHVVAYENAEDPVPKLPPLMSQNWVRLLRIFKTSLSPFKAHSMRSYLHDITAL